MKTFTPAWRRKTMRTRWGVVVLTGALAVVAVMLALVILALVGVFLVPLGMFMGLFF